MSRELLLPSSIRRAFPATLALPRPHLQTLARSLIIWIGTGVLLLAFPQAAPSEVSAFLILLALLLFSETLATPRPTTNGVVSISFVVLAASMFLLGLDTTVALGAFSVVLGDGLLRRRPWPLVWEKVSVLALMLAGGRLAVDALARGAEEMLRLLPHLIMGFWVLFFLAWLLVECRREGRWTFRCTQGAAALLFILALWSEPVWPGYLEALPMTSLFLAAPGLFLLAAAFMFVDNLATSTAQVAAGGLQGLNFWRYSLLPAFYQYNGQALGALLLVWAYQTNGPLGLSVAAGMAALGFYAFRLYVKKEDLLMASLCAFSSALDAKDHYTQGHSDRVATYSVALAKAFGFSTGRQRRVQLAAQLHDIGKIGVPDTVLLKPGKFTPEEYEVMKGHVDKGVEILWNVPELRGVASIIAQEHERWDGSGYPKGLKGEKTTLEARMIAVADVYDALTSDRPYRKALSEEQALEVLGDLAGKELDQRVVQALQALSQREELDAELAFAYCLTH